MCNDTTMLTTVSVRVCVFEREREREREREKEILKKLKCRYYEAFLVLTYS